MKNLTIEQIKSAAKGAHKVINHPQGIHFQRFPDEILTKNTDPENRRIRVNTSAGVVIDFMSDTTSIRIEANAYADAARWYTFFDVYVDETFTSHAGTEKQRADTVKASFQISGSPKQKRIRLYLPHTREVWVKKISIDDKAGFTPTPSRPLLLSFGDSITHGMNSRHPSLTYPAVAARLRGMDLCNAGVGGAKFETIFASCRIVNAPDLITVAYGTNDWSNSLPVENAEKFLSQLRKTYPEARVVVLEPLWRKNDDLANQPLPEGRIPVDEYRNGLSEIVKKHDGMEYVRKDRLYPGGLSMMQDGIHPDTAGQLVTGCNLASLL